MKCEDIRYQTYVKILERELIPAMGCTEPIALAYCAAQAKALLGVLPEKVKIAASGNIIKNVKSVVVPNTGGKRGIEAAAAVGILAGDPKKELEVISSVSEEQKRELDDYLALVPIQVTPSHTNHILDIEVTVESGAHRAKVRIVDEHTNVVYKEKDGAVVFEKDLNSVNHEKQETEKPDYTLLTIEDIFDFARTLEISDVEDILERQMHYNMEISREGLRGDYGANIGKTIQKNADEGDIRAQAKAKAAAASDARMNGCELPVVINSGSGNQGITSSIPVIVYAEHLKAGREELLRALTFSNLVTLHLKSGIGRLSAYCGAVSAGVGAGAGITYLKTHDLDSISHTIVNALAITSGIVCDGAKSSCAAKIAVAVDAGIFGYEMYQNGQQFFDGEGLVCKGVENTIRNIGILGCEGMKETDKKIIEIMTGC